VTQTSGREELSRHLSGGSRTLYCGFDPTADSLHVGSLVPLLALRRFQLYGHRPIALVGGATGLIGDPSFKTSERGLNEPGVVAEWVARLRAQVARFVDTDGNNGAIVVDNLEWTRELDLITFLRDIGKHFSVNAMIQKDAVRARLTREGSGISFTELSYVILQSLDYVELARRYECSLQVGGSDQWGNITSGMDLVRRMLSREAHALTFPLVTRGDGSKFGKSESGTVWLDAKKTSAYAFHQFWLNTSDQEVVAFLNWFTFLDLEEIAALQDEVAQSPERRRAQARLAREVTRLVHGEAALTSAERITAALFSGGVLELSVEEIEQLELDGMGCTPIPVTARPLVEVLEASGLAQSRSAARKLIESKGVSVNGRVIHDVGYALERASALHGRFHLIRRGKKAWHLAAHR